MGIRFLTEEWASTMTEKLNASDDFKSAAANQQVKLQQVVTDTPEGGESKYYFTIEGGEAQVALGEISDAEATITQNYETAVAINKQELNAQNAFMQGKVKISGNMMKLMQLQGVFTAMPKAVDDV
ncbi:MAG TPA: SCP2 sterol-binding domain-containing protein, partial [Actinomycetota bacterium]|nr:SCP2 sterol-binding domain-containing protein [Actinomycetota bacterium]